jgi:hypothetical protein
MTHNAREDGGARVYQRQGWGVNAQSCPALAADGEVLEGLDRSSSKRPEAKDESASHERKKQRSIEEKESFRWLETLERSTAALPAGVKAYAAHISR